MPKFIGNDIAGANVLPNNANPENMVNLTYAQAKKVPPHLVYKSLNTSDKGGSHRLAKRWYNWWVKLDDALEYGMTPKMLLRTVDKAVRMAKRKGEY